MLFNRKKGLTILQKLIGISSLVFFFVSGILLIDIYLFHKIKKTVIEIVDTDISHVIANAELARTLGRIYADTELLINTFSRQEEFLSVDAENILHKLELILAAPNVMNTPELTGIIAAYMDIFGRTVIVCEKIHTTLHSINNKDKKFLAELNRLEKIISERETSALMSGENEEIRSLTKLNEMIHIYKKLSYHVNFLVSESTHAHLSGEFNSNYYPVEIIKSLDEFDTALVELAISGNIYSNAGRGLRLIVDSYKRDVIDLHKFMREFQPLYREMNSAQESIASAMIAIDNRIGQATGDIKSSLISDIHSSRNFVIILFIMINLILLAIWFYVWRSVKPLKSLALISDNLSRGDINCQTLSYETDDEIGILAQSFNRLMEYIKKMAEAARQVAGGDLAVYLAPQSEKDVLGNSISDMIYALRNSRAQIISQLDRLAVLHDIDGMITTGRDIHDILRLILEQIVTELGFDSASVLKKDPETGKFRSFESIGTDSGNVNYSSPVMELNYLSGTIMNKRKSIRTSNFLKFSEKLDLKDRKIIKRRGGNWPRTYYAFPLCDQENIIGVLEVCSKSSVRLDKDSVNFIDTLSGQAAIAINHMRMIRGLENLVKERTVEIMLQKDAILQEKERVQMYLDIAGVMILILDRRGRVRLINKKGCELLGYSEKEIIGKNWFSSFLPARERSEVEPLFLKLMKGEQENIASYENSVITRSRETRIISWKNRLMTDERGNISGILSSGEDITEKKLFEKGLLEAKEIAESATKAKSEFLANMSHEIRTPMNAIIGFSTLAMQMELTPVLRDYLMKINNSSKALLTLINDILDFSKVEAEKLELESIQFSISEVINSAIDMLSFKTGEKKLKLTVFVDPCIPDILIGDPFRLGQVILNLAGNAVKFTEKGSIHLKVEHEGIEGDRCTVKFSVIDTGIGIPEDVLPEIFADFSQADASVTRRYGGTGLGLAISRKLVQLMHGDISVSSVYGRGSEFSFTAQFRMTGTEDETVKKGRKRIRKHQDLITADMFSGYRVLLVEDSVINQQVASGFLENAGFTVDSVSSGADALDALENGEYDLVLLDLQIPDMSGFEISGKIRGESRFSNLPLIAMSAHVMSGIRDECIDAGMNDYISKPVEPEKMFAVLKKWLKNKKRNETVDKTPAKKSFNGTDKKLSGINIDGIDIPVALARLDGNAELLIELFIMFRDNYSGSADQIRKDIKNGDYKHAAYIVHNIKGVSGNLSAGKLFEKSAMLEKAVSSGDDELIFEILTGFELELKSVIDSISNLSPDLVQ